MPIATIETFTNGQLVRLSGQVRVDGVPVEPTEVRIRVVKPGGGQTSYLLSLGQVTLEETFDVDEPLLLLSAIYFVNVTVDIDGLWQWRFESTGAGQSAGYGRFRVGGSFT